VSIFVESSGGIRLRSLSGNADKTMNFAKTMLRASTLSLLTMILAAIPLQAQQQTAQPQQEVKAAKHERGPGQELVHETREAAGEEKDDTAQFKQSPSVAVIARITGLSVNNAYLFSVILNFAVVAGVIVWAGRKFLPGIIRARTAAIQKAMQEAQKASEEAHRRLAEIENRLMKLDGEIGMMRDAAEKEAAAEESRIQAAAKDDARKIVEAAQQEIASAAKAARRQLTAYAADLAVGLAQKQIRIDATTDQALLRNFAGELGDSPSRSSGRDGR
jgi:F-type H+-transporting ATPase subunit b